MSNSPVQITRYPNRRFYNRTASKYLSLRDIEAMVTGGDTVEIRDSQTNEDLTRAVLTRIIMERQPEKMLLFPPDLLHFILRSNEVMGDFLRDYFQHSLTYLDYLQRHSGASALVRPIHWVKAWLDGIGGGPVQNGQHRDAEESARLAQRVAELEARLRQLESKES
jgi:polyhydroxyalkanoate synthesis repressor PhaR